MARKIEQKKPLYKYWFYTGDDDEAMYKAICKHAEQCLGTRWFADAFVGIQNIFRDCRFGHCSQSEIYRTGMRYIGVGQGDLPDRMSQFEHAYTNDTNGLSAIMDAPSRKYATEVVHRLMYGNSSRGDDVIIVNDHWASGMQIYTHRLDSDDAKYFAAMTAALIKCEYAPDKVQLALWYFEKAMGAEAERIQDERQRLVKEIQDKQKRLRELGGEMPKED